MNVVKEVDEHVPWHVLGERASRCLFNLRVHVLEVEMKIPTIPDSPFPPDVQSDVWVLLTEPRPKELLKEAVCLIDFTEHYWSKLAPA